MYETERSEEMESSELIENVINKQQEDLCNANPRTPSGEKVTRKTPVNRIVFRRQTVIEVQNHG